MMATPRCLLKNLRIPQPDTRGLLLISLLSQPLGVSATSFDLWYRNNNKNDTLNENEPRKKEKEKKIIKRKLGIHIQAKHDEIQRKYFPI